MKKLLDYLSYAFVTGSLTVIGLVCLVLTVSFGLVLTALIYFDLFCETVGEVAGHIRNSRSELAWRE